MNATQWSVMDGNAYRPPTAIATPTTAMLLTQRTSVPRSAMGMGITESTFLQNSSASSDADATLAAGAPHTPNLVSANNARICTAAVSE